MHPELSYLLQSLGTIALFAGALYLSRRVLARTVRPAKGPLELVCELPLSSRRSLYLVRLGQRVWLLGASEHGLTRLGGLSGKELDAIPVDEASRDVSVADLRGLWLRMGSLARSQASATTAARRSSSGGPIATGTRSHEEELS